MAKKVVIELWVEPLTKSGNYFNFLDNVDEFKNWKLDLRSDSLKDTGEGIVTFVYHANTMEDKDFDKLKELLESGKAVSYSEFFAREVQDRNTAGFVKQYALAKAKYLAVKLRKLRG